MPQPLVTVNASEGLDKICEVIARDGGVIVANFLPAELLQEVMHAIEPWFKGRKLYTSKSADTELGEGFFSEGSQRIYALLAKIPEQLCKIIKLEIWQGIMERFLSDTNISFLGEKPNPQRSGYMLASSAALRLVPGAKPQPLHRDHIAYLTRHNPNNPLYTPMMGCLIAGSKCTQRNGATAVIPGSHLWDDTRAPKVDECAYAEMEAGSALFTLGSTYHGAGENKCELEEEHSLRTIFAVFGQRDYYRQDQEEILSTPIEIVRQLPEDLLKLCGFYKAATGVGYVEDHQSAAEFIDTDYGVGRFVKVQPNSAAPLQMAL